MKPPLGSGQRFEAIEEKAAASGARDPAAVAAAAGIAAHGKARMSELAQASRRRHRGRGARQSHDPRARA